MAIHLAKISVRGWICLETVGKFYQTFTAYSRFRVCLAVEQIKKYLQTDQDMQDERRFPRKPIIARGEIVASDGSTSLTSSIFNISDGGAMIGTPYDFRFPEVFRLRIAARGLDRPAAVAWQSTGLAGLRFSD